LWEWLNLLIGVPMTTFPQNKGSFGDALVYVLTGGNGVLSSHFFVDMTVIAIGIVTFALIIRKRNAYKILSIAGLIAVFFVLRMVCVLQLLISLLTQSPMRWMSDQF
jgi:hypothetical protein